MPRFIVLRFTLQQVHPPVWRQLLVSPQTSLADVHELIQVAMDWGNYRSYRFENQNQQWGPRDVDEADIMPSNEMTLGEFLPRAGDARLYRYHLTHDWGVLIAHEGTKVKATPGPRLLDGAGNCPPEEMPGPAAYQQVIAAQQGGAEPQDTYLAWLADHFDAERFDLRVTRRAVRQWFGGSAEVIALTTGLPTKEVAGLLRFFRDHLKDASADLKQSMSLGIQSAYDGDEDMDLTEESVHQGGLSQAEMEILIAAPFSPRSPLKISQDLKTEQCETAPFYRLALACLVHLAEKGDWALDAGQQLPMAVVQTLFEVEGASWPDTTQANAPTNEADFFPLAAARQVLQKTGLIRRRKRRAALTLTRKGKAALANPARLFVILLEGFCRYYPWDEWDHAKDDAIGQWGFGYSLLLLRQFGQTSHPARYYAERYLRAMPALTGWDATEDPGAFREQFHAEFARYCARTFDFFGVWWGFTQAEQSPVQLDTSLTGTPFLLDAVEGAFPQGNSMLIGAFE